MEERNRRRRSRADLPGTEGLTGPATRAEREAINSVRINALPRGGNSADYLTARIARDRPDLLERMKSGEFQRVRQAAIAAGVIKAPYPLDLLTRAWAKASKHEKDQFIEWTDEKWHRCLRR